MQETELLFHAVPAARTVVIDDNCDRVCITKLELDPPDTIPNSYVIGISKSVHSDAAKVNVVDNSIPTDGETEAIPGSGGPFVTTVTVAEEVTPELMLTLLRVKTRVLRIGKQFGCSDK